MLRSPYRLLALAIVGSLVSAACFAYPLPPHTRASIPLLLIGFALLVAGLFTMTKSLERLRQAVRNDLWPADVLAPIRRVLDHVLWNVIMGFLIVAMLAVLVLDRHNRHWFWAAFVLLQLQTQTAAAFTLPESPPGAGARLDWSQVPPLHSEHWGEH